MEKTMIIKILERYNTEYKEENGRIYAAPFDGFRPTFTDVTGWSGKDLFQFLGF